MKSLRSSRDQDLREAGALLRKGGIVAIPTETVYGLAANAEDENAVRRIFAVKGRMPDKPLPVLVPDAEGAAPLCKTISPLALNLTKRLWPGPLTLILPSSGALCPLVTAGKATIGLRCPDHPAALAVLRCAGIPLVLTSANVSGGKEAVTPAEVEAFLGGAIDALVVSDDAPRADTINSYAEGVPSTVLDLTCDQPKILRFGGGIFGVTGGSGAGKSLLLGQWRERGVTVINADSVYHEMLQTCMPMLDELRERFPAAFSNRNLLNRAVLSGIVFNDESALADLNDITHKYVIGNVLRQIDELRENGIHTIALEALYLFESGVSDLCVMTFGVLSPVETRVRRLVERDGLSHEDAMLRIQNQKPDSYYREHCDIILVNDGRKEWIP